MKKVVYFFAVQCIAFSIAYPAFAIERPDKNKRAELSTNGIAIYGNWCGPGHGGGEPIDTLDQHCMRHDQCYQETIMFSCSCNEELLDGLSDDISMMGEEEQTFAEMIAAFFAVAPCIPF